MIKKEVTAVMGNAIKRLIRGKMASKDIEYKVLSDRLRSYGIDQTPNNLRTKINTGVLSAQLFVYIQMALEETDAIIKIKKIYQDIEREVACPKCEDKTIMQVIEYGGVEIELCPVCKGMWFDAMERERLGDIPGSERLDNGDPKEGKEKNKVEASICPKCDGKLHRKVDQGYDIQYECCENCLGIFFDAGEFREYKEKYITHLSVKRLDTK